MTRRFALLGTLLLVFASVVFTPTRAAAASCDSLAALALPEVTSISSELVLTGIVRSAGAHAEPHQPPGVLPGLPRGGAGD
jgi:hypothetical protein